MIRTGLTRAGRELVSRAPEVAQGLLVSGLEGLPLKKLNNISECLGDMVRLLGAQELPPRLLPSPEVGLSTATPQARETGGKR